MNAERVRLRKVYFSGLASTLAASLDDLPIEIVRAACDVDAAAKKLLFEINSSRNARKHGF